VGCGRIAPKASLLRIGLRREDGARVAVVDRAATLPGRGAYLCCHAASGAVEPACLARALRKGALSRALRTNVSPSPELVESDAG